MAKIEHPKDAPSLTPRLGHWWLARGPNVHLRCGGDDLPIEWWEGNDRKRRDGGRWWTPMRALALYRWTDDAEREIDAVVGPEPERERFLWAQLAARRTVRARADAKAEGREPSPEELALPDPLPPHVADWVARRRAASAELTDLALAMHPRLAGDAKHGPSWSVLRRAVMRDETWLLRAAGLRIIPQPPIVEGKPILPVSLLVPDDDARMRAAEQLARDMVDPKAVLVPQAEAETAGAAP